MSDVNTNWRHAVDAAANAEKARIEQVRAQQEQERVEQAKRQGAHLRTVLKLLLDYDPGELDKNEWLSPDGYLFYLRNDRGLFSNDYVLFDASVSRQGAPLYKFALLVNRPAPSGLDEDYLNEQWGLTSFEISTEDSLSEESIVNRLRPQVAHAIDEIDFAYKLEMERYHEWRQRQDERTQDEVKPKPVQQVETRILRIEIDPIDRFDGKAWTELDALVNDGWTIRNLMPVSTSYAGYTYPDGSSEPSYASTFMIAVLQRTVDIYPEQTLSVEIGA